VITLRNLYAALDINDDGYDHDDRLITGVNTLQTAVAGELCFAEQRQQVDLVQASKASVVLVPDNFPSLTDACPHCIRCHDPRSDFFRIADTYFKPVDSFTIGIHPQAQIAEDVVLAPDVSIGAGAVLESGVRIGVHTRIGPYCVLETNVQIGADCVLQAHITIGSKTQIGDRCRIAAGTVIGGEGFGFRWDGSQHCKIPQLGQVVIEDDVEIGSLCCVDRATIGVTRISRGTKIDNLVQIAHNVTLGEHVIIAGQAGVAGSSHVGDRVVIGGQVAVSDHRHIAADARIGGQAGVTRDIDAAAAVSGTPARPLRRYLREQVALSRLPALVEQCRLQDIEIRSLRQRLAQIEALLQTE
jgi:UDP-3-O-[3-hydroxymyristoyl] glucosamine N-acyltransferase